MSWAMKMAVWGRTSSWGHRRTWKSCSLVCWRSPWAFSLLCPSCNTNNSQSPCKRTSKRVLLLSPFARCGQPPQRGCQLPQQQPQPIPLSPLHFTIALSRSWWSYFSQILSVVCCVVVTRIVSSTFLHSLHDNKYVHLVKKINFVTKRSPTTLDPGVSNTSRRLVRTKQIRNIANIHPSQKRDFKRFKKWFSICHPPQISEGGHGADSQVVEQLAPGFPGFD